MVNYTPKPRQLRQPLSFSDAITLFKAFFVYAFLLALIYAYSPKLFMVTGIAVVAAAIGVGIVWLAKAPGD